jgi:hypothetical protein
VKNKPYDIKEEKPFIVSESFVPYEKQEENELQRIRQAILSTPTEKFKVLMTLMKVNEMMKRAKIHHKPDF